MRIKIIGYEKFHNCLFGNIYGIQETIDMTTLREIISKSETVELVESSILVIDITLIRGELNPKETITVLFPYKF